MIRRTANGLDLYIYQKLGMDAGYFVDVGAHDGKDGNNTYALEKAGWSGICIEPSPVHKADLKKNRKCIVDDSLVYSERTTKKFFVHDYSEPHNQFAKFKQELEQKGSKLDIINTHSFLGGSGIVEHLTKDYEEKMVGKHIELETVTLLDVLEAHKAPKIIDFLDIDTEGSEYEVIKNFPFSEYEFKIISVEIWKNTKDIMQSLLNMNGYQRVKILGDDYIFEKI